MHQEPITLWAPVCTYQCYAGGGRGRTWGGDLIVFVGPGVGHLADLVPPGRGYLNLSSPDVEIRDSDEKD